MPDEEMQTSARTAVQKWMDSLEVYSESTKKKNKDGFI